MFSFNESTVITSDALGKKSPAANHSSLSQYILLISYDKYTKGEGNNYREIELIAEKPGSF